MNIRTCAVSLLIFATPGIFAMNSYGLKDALELARNLGVQQDDLTVLSTSLLKESRQYEGSVIISQDTVYEKISNLMVKRLLEETRVPEGQLVSQPASQVPAASVPAASAVPVVPAASSGEAPAVSLGESCDKQADPFDAEFASKLADIRSLVAIGRNCDAAGDQENSLHVMQGISSVHQSLEDELVKRSKNKWFLTGSLLDKKLRLNQVKTVATDAGLCIPHSLETTTPLHHLVSHHQIFSSCGFNTLANAYAIERQAREGLPITAECTRKYAEYCFAHTLTRSAAFKRLLFDGGINVAHSEEFGQAADDILKNYNMLIHMIYLSTAEIPSFEDETTRLPIIELIKSNPAVHFGYNLGGHWVLISIVKNQNSYALYHLNSANSPIDAGHMGPVVAYLDGLLRAASSK